MADNTGAKILTPKLIWRDGDLISFADATVHVLSHMAARGSQIFDVMMAVSGDEGPRVLGLREHVARFVQSAETMGMAGLPDVGAIESAIAETVLANLAANGIEPDQSAPLVIKIIASWDDPAIDIAPATATPSVYIVITPWTSDQEKAATLDFGRSPIKVKTAEMPKIPASILPPSMKVAAGYLPGIRHHLKARAEGFDQVIFRTVDGDMAEGVTASYFVVRNGRMTVPPVDSVLDGITRRAVLDVAMSLDIPTQVRSVRWSDVAEADEIFLTSTTKVIWAVGQMDDRNLEAPGPVSDKLAAAMRAMLRGDHQLSGRWMTPLIPLHAG